MIQADLIKIREQNTELMHHASEFMRQIQELDEIERLLKCQGDLADFVPVIHGAAQELYSQAEVMKQMSDKLGDIADCYERSEKEIVREYEQERMTVSRFAVKITDINQNIWKLLKVDIRF